MAKKNTSVYFNGISTLSDLEQKYLELLMVYVEDADKVVAINTEYDSMFEKLKKAYNKTAEEWQKVHESPQEMREVVAKLFAFKDEENGLDFRRDVKVELCGTWLWIQPADGKPADTTKKYSKILNRKTGVGCDWSTKKSMWYWHSTTGKKKWIPRKQSYTMEQIRTTYGSRIIDSDEAV